jgi:hypothetical protein
LNRDFPFDVITAEKYDRMDQSRCGLRDAIAPPGLVHERTEGIKTYARGYLVDTGGERSDTEICTV